VVLIFIVAALFFGVARAIPTRRKAMLVIGGLLLAAALGARFTPYSAYAVHEATTFTKDQLVNLERTLAAAEQFKRDVATDPFRAIPGERLLTRLKGNDVLLIFVRSGSAVGRL
jgi:hypothetical protein